MKNNILDVALKDPKFKYAYDFGINNGLIKFDERLYEYSGYNTQGLVNIITKRNSSYL